MPFLRIAIVVVLAIAGSSLRAAEPTTESLIDQLGSKSFAERERASKALKERGPVVLPSLQKALATKDEEVRKRLDKLIATVEIEWAMKPTLLTIDADDQPTKHILDQLEKQTGASFAIVGKDVTRTIHFKNVPFWEALDRLDTQTGRLVFCGSHPSEMRAGAPSKFHVTHGPFRVQAIRVLEDREIQLAGERRRNELAIELIVKCEPRITIKSVQQAKIEKAEDSEGNSLKLEEGKGDEKKAIDDFDEDDAFKGRSIRSNMTHAELRRASQTAKSIKLIKGTIPVHAMLIQESILLSKNATDSVGAEVSAGFEKIKITKVESPNGKDLEVSFRIEYPTMPAAEQGFRVLWDDRIALFDEAGNEFFKGRCVVENLRGWSEVRILFEPKAGKPTGPPKKLTFQKYVFHEFEIPFEFRDIPLP